MKQVKMTAARGLKFYLKVFATFLALILIAVSIAIGYVYYQLSTTDKLEKIVVAQASKALAMPLKLERFQFSFPSVALKKVELATDTPKLSLNLKVDSIYVRPDLWAIISGKFLISSLELSSSTSVLKLKKTDVKIAKQAQPETAKKLELDKFPFPFKAVYLNNISLKVFDENTNENYLLSLKEAQLSESLLGSSFPFSAKLSAKDYADVEIAGSLLWPKSVSSNISLEKVNLTKIQKFVPKQYLQAFKTVTGGSLSASLVYYFSNKLDVSSLNLSLEPGIKVSGRLNCSQFSPLMASVSASISPIETENIMKIAQPFLPKEYGIKATKGNLSGEIKLSIVNSALGQIDAKLRPTGILLSAKPLPEPITIDNADVEYANSGFKFANLSVSGLGASLKLTQGTASLSPVAANLKLEASVDFTKLWKHIVPYVPAVAKDIIADGKMVYHGEFVYKDSKPYLSGNFETTGLKVFDKQKKAEVTIASLKAKLQKFGLETGTAEIDKLDLDGFGTKLVAKGNFKNAKDPELDITTTGNIDLKSFSAVANSIFKLNIKPQQFTGTIALNAGVKGKISALKPHGNLTLKNVKADLNHRGLFVQNLSGKAVAEADKLKVENFQANLMGGSLAIKGELVDFTKPKIDAQASMKNTNLDMVRVFLSKNFPDMPKEIVFGGKADLELTLNGDVYAPTIKGTAQIPEANFFHPAILRPLEKISGPIIVDNKGIYVNKVKANWGKSVAFANGSLTDWNKFNTNFNYTVNPIDLSDIGSFFLKDTGYKLSGIGSGSGKVSGPIETVLVTGIANVPGGQFEAPVDEKGATYKFPFTNLTAPFKFFKDVFSVTKAKMDIFNGKVEASGNVYVKTEPITFDFKTNLTRVQAQSFMAKNTKYPKALSGDLSGKFNAKGNTLGLVSLNGDASLTMVNGAYDAPPVVKNICNQLKASHLATGTIHDLTGDCKLENGRFNTNNLKGKTNDALVTFNGYVGMDTTMNATANIGIKREACMKSSILKQMVGKSPSLNVPVKLKGTLTSPGVSIPINKMLEQSAKKNIKKGLEDKAKDALKRIFGGGKKKNTTNQTETQKTGEAKPAQTDNVKKKIKDVGKDIEKGLKKLFKF